jgi:phosphoglycolate/pyridoxal phosphate phosphatase family enzyme
MTELVGELKNIQLAIFDLDGVVYRGDSLIPNADVVINKLKDLSIKVVYNSNNSTATRKTYVERLKKFNIHSNITDFYTSASITASEITKIKEKANVYVIGETGLKQELKSLGHNLETNPKNYAEIDFVIVGLDREFNYDKLAIAQRCILEGNAQFYATNVDSTLPVANGFLPGAGTMVNALITCIDKEPIRIFGKPEPFGIDLILRDTNTPPEKACIFGDRLNTDILAGNRAKITTVAVLTGVTTRDMIDNLKKKMNNSTNLDTKIFPDLIINNLAEIFKNR